MNDLRSKFRLISYRMLLPALTVSLMAAGCAPQYHVLRRQGQSAMAAGAFGPARYFFQQAHELSPRRIDNLHDLGVCSVMLAREKLHQMNRPAALRELDSAVAFFSRVLHLHPGHIAALEGKTTALELKGRFDDALKEAEWAAKFVGPAAKHYVFLAKELEERGDVDGALLRFRQAVAIEPENSTAHVAFARFLFRHNNETSAVRHLQAAYRLNPTDAWVTDQLVARSALPALVPAAATDAP